MKHLGDITKINGAKVPMVDVITFGAPCQDLSVAGKRAGMKNVAMGDDETTRSGLFFEAIRIIKEMRDESFRQLSMRGTDVDIRLVKPRYAVYENVPGAFSSNKGEDFRAVLEETAKVADKNAVIPGPPAGKWQPAGCIVGDGWSLAWRVHDAQYWGVPQRRKRICLLADFNGQDAGRVLFELRRNTDEIFTKQTIMDLGIKSRYEIQSVSKGLPGNIEESGKAGESAAEDIRSGIKETSGAISFQERAGKPGGGKGILIQNEHVGALSTLNNQSVCCLNDQGGSVMGVSKNVTGALRAQEHGHQPIVYGISAYESNAMKSGNPNSGIYEAETSRTLDLNGGNPACNQGGMAVVCATTEMTPKTDEDGVSFSLRSRDYKDPQIVCLEGNGSRPSHQGDGWHEGDPMYTLNSTEHHAVAIENHPADSRVKVSEDGIVQTLSGRMGTGGGNVPMVMEPVCVGNGQLAQARISDKVGALNCMHDQQAVITYQAVVRRLTPLECTRLQGFPDGWVDIGEWVDSKGKVRKESDAPKYKALGNSIALPFWKWLAERIREQYSDNNKITMASLFSGIGGFELVFAQVGIKPVWCSEIEDFPIAVAKKHFPDMD